MIDNRQVHPIRVNGQDGEEVVDGLADAALFKSGAVNLDIGGGFMIDFHNTLQFQFGFNFLNGFVRNGFVAQRGGGLEQAAAQIKWRIIIGIFVFIENLD